MTILPTGSYFVNNTDEEGRKCVKKVMKKRGFFTMQKSSNSN